MSGKIQTYTGKIFDFEDIENSEICIEDIAHALSLTCRFTGHIPEFYSVAEHSVIASSIASDSGWDREYCLAVLLHDASEAYINDICRPAKPLLPQYKVLEEKIQTHIYEDLSINITGEVLNIIKTCDEVMLLAEMYKFFPKRVFKWEVESLECSVDEIFKVLNNIKCMSNIRARHEFMRYYNNYSS